MPRDGWTTVSSLLRTEEAELIRGLLESAGIAVVVEDAAISALNPLLQSAVGGAKVLVPVADAARAASIVSESGLFGGAPGEAVEIPEEEWSTIAAPDAGRPGPGPGHANEEPDREETGEHAAGHALRASFAALALSGTLVAPLYAIVASLRSFRTVGAPTRRTRVRRAWALAVSTFALALAPVTWILAFPAPHRVEAGGGGAPSRARPPIAQRPAAPQPVAEITFQNVLSKEEQADTGERTTPYVNLADPERAIARLVDPDRVVLDRPSVEVHVDYPLARPVKMALAAPSPRGFTRAELARAIARLYQQIYAEEERTARVKTVPRDRRGPLVNRNETDGRYGICCHDLSDLDLHTVTVYRTAGGDWFLELGIDS